MSSQIFLHDHPDFPGLLSIVANDVGVAEALVEKDHRWESLQASWEAIDLMFWGRRVALEHCAQRIRGLLTQLNKKP